MLEGCFGAGAPAAGGGAGAARGPPAASAHHRAGRAVGRAAMARLDPAHDARAAGVRASVSERRGRLLRAAGSCVEGGDF